MDGFAAHIEPHHVTCVLFESFLNVKSPELFARLLPEGLRTIPGSRSMTCHRVMTAKSYVRYLRAYWIEIIADILQGKASIHIRAAMEDWWGECPPSLPPFTMSLTYQFSAYVNSHAQRPLQVWQIFSASDCAYCSVGGPMYPQGRSAPGSRGIDRCQIAID